MPLSCAARKFLSKPLAKLQFPIIPLKKFLLYCIVQEISRVMKKSELTDLHFVIGIMH